MKTPGRRSVPAASAAPAVAGGGLARLLPVLLVILGLQGCVLGYGRCKFTEPVRTSLTGHVHFREYNGERFDRAPILVLDRTEYVYVSSRGKQCQAATEVQLIPMGDLPDDIAEGAHVVAEGSLVLANQLEQHTRFVFNLGTIRLIKQ